MRSNLLLCVVSSTIIFSGCGGPAELLIPDNQNDAAALALDAANSYDPSATLTSVASADPISIAAPIAGGAAPAYSEITANPGGDVEQVNAAYYASGPQGYYIYEPTGVSSAPVIAFFHAYNTLDPSQYGGWIKRLVDAKYTVIFPVFQDYITLDTQFTDNALNAVKNAFTILRQSGHVFPAAGKFAVFGHSLGCVVGINVAALGPANGLPAPKVILLANPGDADAVLSLPSIMLSSYSAIPSTTRFVALTGDMDTVVGNTTAINLYNKLTQIPAAQKNVIEFFSDNHGLPPIIAQHGSCLAIDPNFVAKPPQASPGGNAAPRWAFQNPGGPISSTIDTLDYKGYWFIGDTMLNWAFKGAAWTLPPGGPPKTMSMGSWSDGVAVKPAQILLP